MGALFSVAALFMSVFVSFWTKVNLGIVCIGFSFFVGYFLNGMSAESIYVKGFPLRLFFLLLGTTLFSSVALSNGTYAVFSKPVAHLAKGRRRFLCFLFFAISFVFAALGMGTIVTPALIMPFLLEMANVEDVPEFLTILLCISGSIAGGLSNIAPTGVLGAQLAETIGVERYTPIWIAAILTFCLQGLLFFLAFGGTKLSRGRVKPPEPIVMSGSQLFTFTVFLGVVMAILAFKFDIGLTTFTGAALLLLCGAGDQGKAIAKVTWSTLLILSGASILFYVILSSGGVTLVEQYLSARMTTRNAGSIGALIAGAMSLFSSSTAVVMPTLIPTVPDMTAAAGLKGNSISSMFMMAAIIIGTHSVAYSPVSTMGAIGMTLASPKTDPQKLFTQLFGVAVTMLLLTAVLFLIGFYDALAAF
jgi:di/tricarboxylate transporter